MLQTTSRQPKCQILGQNKVQLVFGIWIIMVSTIFSSNPESLSEAFQHIFGPNWLIWDNRRGNVQGAYLRKGGFFSFFSFKNSKIFNAQNDTRCSYLRDKKNRQGRQGVRWEGRPYFSSFFVVYPSQYCKCRRQILRFGLA